MYVYCCREIRSNKVFVSAWLTFTPFPIINLAATWGYQQEQSCSFLITTMNSNYNCELLHPVSERRNGSISTSFHVEYGKPSHFCLVFISDTQFQSFLSKNIELHFYKLNCWKTTTNFLNFCLNFIILTNNTIIYHNYPITIGFNQGCGFFCFLFVFFKMKLFSMSSHALYMC